MGDKNKENKKKEKKIHPVLEGIRLAFNQTTEAQKALMESAPLLSALTEYPGVLDALKQSAMSLRYVSELSKMLMKEQKEIVRALLSSGALSVVSDFRQDLQKLAELTVGIREMVKMNKNIDVPTLLPKIEAIPSQTNAVINGLLRHIDFLEREMAKERQKNKELLKLLEEKRKELKKKYVA